MRLTPEQQAVLDGARGQTLAKVMKTLVMYGDVFGAERMEPVTGAMGHLVTSFGLSVMKPVFALMDELIQAGAVSTQHFTVDPRPLDKNVPSNFLQNIVFGLMYGKQDAYEKQLEQLGIASESAFTCTGYMGEVGNIPKKGDVLSWAESSAVVYANSVLGARCNRNSGIIDLFGSIAGCVPYFGLLTDEGRRASWIIEVNTKKKPDPQLLGSAIGFKVLEDVPFIKGLTNYLGTELNDTVRDYLKDMGASSAASGAVGLYHVEGLTPEAAEQGETLIKENAQVYIIDDEELDRVRKSFPNNWKEPKSLPKLCFIGCPHLSAEQLDSWCERLEKNLKGGKVKVPTVMTAAPAVLESYKRTPNAAKLEKMGVILSYICPLMYLNNPLCGKMPVITCSGKLRTYTRARYFTESALIKILTGGRDE